MKGQRRGSDRLPAFKLRGLCAKRDKSTKLNRACVSRGNKSKNRRIAEVEIFHLLSPVHLRFLS